MFNNHLFFKWLEFAISIVVLYSAYIEYTVKPDLMST